MVVAMFIESIKYKLPSKKISNQDCLDKIRKQNELQSKDHGDDLEKLLNTVNLYFEKSGSVNRNSLAENETPIGLLKEAFNDALEEAGWKKEEVELLIYVGVCRGFIEPGGSYVTADALGAYNAHCFDIVDACMSWTRALHIVEHFLKEGTYKKVAIVNAEFNIQLYGKDMYDIKTLEQIEYLFPALTIGEAASVTLISDKIEKKSKFAFWSGPEYVDLCTIPVNNYQLFTDNTSKKLGKNGPMHFTSYGKEMHIRATPFVIGVFQELGISKEQIDIVFTHASSNKMWEKYGELVGLADKMYHIFPKTGNLVSASIPVSIAMALEDSKLKRGDSVFLWVGSAGASTAAVNFEY
jgi:acyl-CoA:acyl-CoA alkyltransferase